MEIQLNRDKVVDLFGQTIGVFSVAKACPSPLGMLRYIFCSYKLYLDLAFPFLLNIDYESFL